MSYQTSVAGIKRAQHLHAVLLFDFIVIHIFFFILALSLIKNSYLPLTLCRCFLLACSAMSCSGQNRRSHMNLTGLCGAT